MTVYEDAVCGLWRRVAWQKFTDASEERAASSFKAISVSSILKMDAARSSETSATSTDYTLLHPRKR
jgi:hypothetical protein